MAEEAKAIPAAKTIMAAGLAITSMAVFIQFIYEESLQTMAMGAYTLITAKEWAAAEQLLGDIEELNKDFKWTVDNVGLFAPQTWGAYHAYHNAVQKQIFAYRRMLQKHMAQITEEMGSRLYVTSTPSDAKIALNREPTGETTPYLFTNLTPGMHAIEVEKWNPWVREIERGLSYAYVTANEKTSIDVPIKVITPAKGEYQIYPGQFG